MKYSNNLCMITLFLQRLEREWPRLLWGGFLGVAFLASLSFTLPKQFSSTMRLLVVQANVAGLDPYTAVKSTEQIAGSVRELTYTSLVANRVLSETDGLDTEYFPEDEYRRRRTWQKTVEVGLVPGTGILTVTVFHPERDQARRLVEGVARQIIEQTPNFGYNAQAKVIDTPLPSRWFARPDIVLNGLFGGLIGVFLALLSLFFKEIPVRRKGR